MAERRRRTRPADHPMTRKWSGDLLVACVGLRGGCEPRERIPSPAVDALSAEVAVSSLRMVVVGVVVPGGRLPNLFVMKPTTIEFPVDCR